jgi:hypothetical protein
VENAPLILGDCSSIPKADLVEVDKVLPDKVEKAYFIHHRPYHRWLFLSDQEPDELLIFASWTPETGTEFAGK